MTHPFITDTGHTDARKGERQRVQLERELRMGIVEPDSMKLTHFMEDSLAKTGDQIRESTRKDYEYAMKHFVEIIVDIDFQHVRQCHGEFFRQTGLDKGNSPVTVAKKIRELKRFFQLAVERGQLEENPLKYLKVPKSPKKKNIRIYTPYECDRMIAAATEIQDGSVFQWDIMITLALVTGMRKSELLNCTWPDIDFEMQTVEVSAKDYKEAEKILAKADSGS